MTIKNVSLNPTRTGLVDVLINMGANIKVNNQQVVAGEVVGDLQIKSSHLHNVGISGDIIPRLIDEIPILALAAAVADGEMVIADAKELRVKETDRITAVCRELKNLGVAVSERPDGFVIRGSGQLQS